MTRRNYQLLATGIVLAMAPAPGAQAADEEASLQDSIKESELGFVMYFNFMTNKDGSFTPVSLPDRDYYCDAVESFARVMWDLTLGQHFFYKFRFYDAEKYINQEMVRWGHWDDDPGMLPGKHRRLIMYDMALDCRPQILGVEDDELVRDMACVDPSHTCWVTPSPDETITEVGTPPPAGSEIFDPDIHDQVSVSRRSVCVDSDGHVARQSAEFMGWVLAHDYSHYLWDLPDEYDGGESLGVCVGQDWNDGNEHTSMMAARNREHWCDEKTHIGKDVVRDPDSGEPFLRSDGTPFEVFPNGTTKWEKGGKTTWDVWNYVKNSANGRYAFSELHNLKYSRGDYDDFDTAFPGLPIHDSDGTLEIFCQWRVDSDGVGDEDVMFVLDRSGSMNWQQPDNPTGPTAFRASYFQAASYYRQVSTDRRSGILGFSTALHPLVDYDQVDPNANFPNATPSGQTDVCKALREGARQIRDKTDRKINSAASIILLSDGLSNTGECTTPEEVLDVVPDICRGNEDDVPIEITAISAGGADTEMLDQIAGRCGESRNRNIVLPLASDGVHVNPLTVKTGVARAGRWARNLLETRVDTTRVDTVVTQAIQVPPGTRELRTEWLGDGFRFDPPPAPPPGPTGRCLFEDIDFYLHPPFPGTDIHATKDLDGDIATVIVTDPTPGLWTVVQEVGPSYLCTATESDNTPGTPAWGTYDPRIAMVSSIGNADLHAAIDVNTANPYQGTPVILRATLTTNQELFTDISVETTVTHRDSGTPVSVVLVDDGSGDDDLAGDGRYTGTFNASSSTLVDPGAYIVNARFMAQNGVANLLPVHDPAFSGPDSSPPRPANTDVELHDEVSFTYRACATGDCSDDIDIKDNDIPGGDSDDACLLIPEPGVFYDDVEVETTGLRIGSSDGLMVHVTGSSATVSDITLVNYNQATRTATITFDLDMHADAEAIPRGFQVGYAGRKVSTGGCEFPNTDTCADTLFLHSCDGVPIVHVPAADPFNGSCGFTSTVITGAQLVRVGNDVVSPPAPIDLDDPRIVLPVGANVIRWQVMADGTPLEIDQIVQVIGSSEVKHCCAPGHTVVQGGSGSETIARVDSGNYCIFGNGGDDVVVTFGGSDVHHSGAGALNATDYTGDFVAYGGGLGDNIAAWGTGDKLVHVGANGDVVSTGNGDAVVFGGPGSDNINTGSGDDLIVPGTGANQVNAGSGNDRVDIFASCEIAGMSGTTLRGGSGSDTLRLPGSLTQLNSAGVTVISFEQILEDRGELSALADCP